MGLLGSIDKLASAYANIAAYEHDPKATGWMPLVANQAIAIVIAIGWPVLFGGSMALHYIPST